jgi:hypothetical protein
MNSSSDHARVLRNSHIYDTRVYLYAGIFTGLPGSKFEAKWILIDEP